MSIRGIGDAFAVQRLLWLLVGTVVVPTILLAAYGVAAIRAQEVALLSELQRQQEESLQSAARLLFDEVARIDADAHDSARRCGAPPCAHGPGIAQLWAWTDAPPTDLEGLPASGEVTVWYTPADGSAPVGVFRVGALTAAFRLDPGHLRAHLSAAGRLGPAVALLEVPGPGQATSYDEMLARWQAPDHDLVLERPLAQWRLAVVGPADDARRQIVWQNRWFYALGLAALVGLVLVGAFVTLGSASREIRLSRLQTDFVSSVSHELRTPLTSIQMFVETLQSGRLRDPARIQECLDLLGVETERLSRRIERVLGWARMEAGRRIYEFEPLQAATVVDAAIQAVRSQTLQDEPEISVAIPDGLPDLHGDRDALVEAVVNLLQNAVRYTPSPRRIAVRASTRGRHIGLTVADNGPGIAARHRKRIFEKFYQADNLLASPSVGRGTGLGLAIVRAVVRAHGGSIELDTEVGAGCRFTIWLPVRAPTR